MKFFYIFFKFFFSFWLAIFSSIHLLQFFNLISFFSSTSDLSQIGLIVPIAHFAFFFLSSFFIGFYFWEYFWLFLRRYWVGSLLISAGCAGSLGLGYQYFFEHAHWDVVCFTVFFYFIVFVYLETRKKLFYLVLAFSVFIFILFISDPFDVSLSIFNDVSHKILQPYGSSVDYGRPYYSPALKWVDESKKLGLFNEHEWWTQYFKPVKSPDPTWREFRIMSNKYSKNYPKRVFLGNTYISTQPRFVPSSKLAFVVFFFPSFIFFQAFFASFYIPLSAGSLFFSSILGRFFGPVFLYTVPFISVTVLLGFLSTFLIDFDYFLLFREIFDHRILKPLSFYPIWYHDPDAELKAVVRPPQFLSFAFAYGMFDFYFVASFCIFVCYTIVFYADENDHRKIETEDQSYFLTRTMESILHFMYPKEHIEFPINWIDYDEYLDNFKDFRELHVDEELWWKEIIQPRSFRSVYLEEEVQSYWQYLRKGIRRGYSAASFWRKRTDWFSANDLSSFALISPRFFPSHKLYYESFREYWEITDLGFGMESYWTFVEFEHEVTHYDHFTGEKFVELGRRHEAEFPVYEQSIMLWSVLEFNRIFSYYSVSEFKILTIVSKFSAFSTPAFSKGSRFTSFFGNTAEGAHFGSDSFGSLISDFLPDFQFYYWFSIPLSQTYSYFNTYAAVFLEFWQTKLVECIKASDFSSSDDLPDLFSSITSHYHRFKAALNYQKISATSGAFTNYPKFSEFLYIYGKKGSVYDDVFYSGLSKSYYDSANTVTLFSTAGQQLSQIFPWYLGKFFFSASQTLGSSPIPGESQLSFFDDVFEDLECSFFSHTSFDCHSFFLSSDNESTLIPNFEDYIISSKGHFGTSFDNFSTDLLEFFPKIPIYPSSSFYDLDKFLERSYYLDLEPFKFSSVSLPSLVKCGNPFPLLNYQSFSNVSFAIGDSKDWLVSFISDFVQEKEFYHESTQCSETILSQFNSSFNYVNSQLSLFFSFSLSVEQVLKLPYQTGLDHAYFSFLEFYSKSFVRNYNRKNRVSFLIDPARQSGRFRPFSFNFCSFIDYFTQISSFYSVLKPDPMFQYESDFSPFFIFQNYYEDLSKSDYRIFMNSFIFNVISKRARVNTLLTSDFNARAFEIIPCLSASFAAVPEIVYSNFFRTFRNNSFDFFSSSFISYFTFFLFKRANFFNRPDFWFRQIPSNPGLTGNDFEGTFFSTRVKLFSFKSLTLSLFEEVNSYKSMSFEFSGLGKSAEKPTFFLKKFSRSVFFAKIIYFFICVLADLFIFGFILFTFFFLDYLSFLEFETLRFFTSFYVYMLCLNFNTLKIGSVWFFVPKLIFYVFRFSYELYFFFFKPRMAKFFSRYINLFSDGEIRNLVHYDGPGVNKFDFSYSENFLYNTSIGFLGYNNNFESTLHMCSPTLNDSDIFFSRSFSSRVFRRFFY